MGRPRRQHGAGEERRRHEQQCERQTPLGRAEAARALLRWR
ncbi:MAG: hypothetical protein OEU25_18450 [Rhodospirillales bacterium]|nr:hypothetical protein [Rhodospirillales bacterium]